MSTYDFMKSTAVVPFESLRQTVLTRLNGDGNRRHSKRRFSLRSSSGEEAPKNVVQRIDIENLLTKSNHTIVSRRFYIESVDSPEYNGIGWILHDGVTNCMFCGTFFGSMQSKHNCAACGLVACANCSNNYVVINELKDEKNHRACKNCSGKSEAITAMDKFKRAPRGRVSESILPLPPQSPAPASTATVESFNATNTEDTESLYADSVTGGETAVSHAAFMKVITNKPLHEVKLELKRGQGGHAIKRRTSLVRPNSQQGIFVVSDLVEEQVQLSEDRSITVSRVYVASSNGGAYSDLGWVVKDEATHCMECLKPFGTLRSKYHCKACGDLVCNSCSPFMRKIVELSPYKTFRVCGRCHNGSLAEDAMHFRLRRAPQPRRPSSLSRGRPEYHFFGNEEKLEDTRSEPQQSSLPSSPHDGIVSPRVNENLKPLSPGAKGSTAIDESHIADKARPTPPPVRETTDNTGDRPNAASAPTTTAAKAGASASAPEAVPGIDEDTIPTFTQTPAASLFCYFLF